MVGDCKFIVRVVSRQSCAQRRLSKADAKRGLFPRTGVYTRSAMNAEELRSLQAPLKEQYREQPDAARITLRARGELDDTEIACSVETGRALVQAGLHPRTGGDGLHVCSGDMLLQALAACAGVTLKAVATALNVTIAGGTVSAEGDLDFRGTLGVARDAPVGFSDIRLTFDLETDAAPELVSKVVDLTERYCVVYQTLKNSPNLSVAAT
jgi:uncharacterized OsmC-like protein